MRAFLVAVVFLCLLSSGKSCADDLTAESIREKVIVAYATAPTYKTQGIESTLMEVQGKKIPTSAEFTVVLKKPALYRISWKSSGPFSGVLWNDGGEPSLYLDQGNEYSKMKTDVEAMFTTAQINGGMALMISSLFFDQLKMPSPLKHWDVIERAPDEYVDGVDCYVISGKTPVSEKETIWVSKVNYFILRYDHSLRPPSGENGVPGLSDKSLEYSLQADGVEVIEERKMMIREQIQHDRKTLMDQHFGGIVKQKYYDITTPDLNLKDFHYQLPEGAILKESVFQ
jgi:outer membrane lipoprotein-sorting protein